MNTEFKTKVVTRDDFIASYIGLTEKKTREFLEVNLGTHLVLDANSILIVNDKDIHGI